MEIGAPRERHVIIERERERERDVLELVESSASSALRGALEQPAESSVRSHGGNEELLSRLLALLAPRFYI